MFSKSSFCPSDQPELRYTTSISQSDEKDAFQARQVMGLGLVYPGINFQVASSGVFDYKSISIALSLALMASYPKGVPISNCDVFLRLEEIHHQVSIPHHNLA